MARSSRAIRARAARRPRGGPAHLAGCRPAAGDAGRGRARDRGPVTHARSGRRRPATREPAPRPLRRAPRDTGGRHARGWRSASHTQGADVIGDRGARDARALADGADREALVAEAGHQRPAALGRGRGGVYHGGHAGRPGPTRVAPGLTRGLASARTESWGPWVLSGSLQPDRGADRTDRGWHARAGSWRRDRHHAGPDRRVVGIDPAVSRRPCAGVLGGVPGTHDPGAENPFLGTRSRAWKGAENRPRAAGGRVLGGSCRESALRSVVALLERGSRQRQRSSAWALRGRHRRPTEVLGVPHGGRGDDRNNPGGTIGPTAAAPPDHRGDEVERG